MKTAYQSLFLIKQHVQLYRFMAASAPLNGLIRHQLGLIYKYMGPYLALHFSTQQRLKALTYHYSFLERMANPHFFQHLWKIPVIWTDTMGEDSVAIRLEFPVGIDFEGDLMLVFTMNQQPIYALSFTFVLASSVGQELPDHQTLFISRVQGSRQFELIKQVTKRLHDITPAALLMAALQGIALAFNIHFLLGVSTQNQLYEPTERTKGHFFNYDAYWESFGGIKQPGFFCVPTPFSEKPLTALKANHRSRTLRKRHYKHELSQSVYRYSLQNFIR